MLKFIKKSIASYRRFKHTIRFGVCAKDARGQTYYYGFKAVPVSDKHDLYDVHIKRTRTGGATFRFRRTMTQGHLLALERGLDSALDTDWMPAI